MHRTTDALAGVDTATGHTTGDAPAVDTAAGPDAPPELPDLEPGVTLLAADERTRHALHALVVDAVLRDGATARWVDARGHASTRPLVSLAPGPRALERVHVARGFTPFQHYSVVETLVARADALDPGLVVAPAVDAMYRADEVRTAEGREMLARVLAALSGLARRRDVPVLCTRASDDEFAEPVANAADATLECTWTSQGPRFAGSDFETLVYPVGGGQLQTTLAYWERVLDARAAAAAGEPAARGRPKGDRGTGERRSPEPATATAPDPRRAGRTGSAAPTREVTARGAD
ncbi:MAG: hypothetical protein ABEJ42_00370 [Halobacteriaceae archaeon]